MSINSIKKELKWILISFILISGVSIYRQISIHFLTGDIFRPYIVYICYLTLIVGWGISIVKRIQQKSMRNMMLAEDTIIFLWMTVRFVQDAFLSGNLYQMRITGYYAVVPLVGFPLFGLYASMCLGKSDLYKINKWWYLLFIPMISVIALYVTNEYHHLIFKVKPGDAAVNLHFYPTPLCYVIIMYSIILGCIRLYLIYKQARLMKISPLIKILPMIVVIIMFGFNIPYFAASFIVDWEFIEHTAGVGYIEALIWESCIITGMVPVNTEYEEVFKDSTFGMQITDKEGCSIISSRYAPVIDKEVFEKLKAEKTLLLPEGKELHLSEIGNHYLVWVKDVSSLIDVVDQLSNVVEELDKENVIMQKEMKIRSEEAVAAEKNKIYSQMTNEVGDQLRLILTLLDQVKTSDNKEVLFKKICFIGTYIKQRSNLRIIEQTQGFLMKDEMYFAIKDISDCLKDMGIDVKIHWDISRSPTAENFIYSLDKLESKVEEMNFDISSVYIDYLGKEHSIVKITKSNRSVSGV